MRSCSSLFQSPITCPIDVALVARGAGTAQHPPTASLSHWWSLMIGWARGRGTRIMGCEYAQNERSPRATLEPMTFPLGQAPGRRPLAGVGPTRASRNPLQSASVERSQRHSDDDRRWKRPGGDELHNHCLKIARCDPPAPPGSPSYPGHGFPSARGRAEDARLARRLVRRVSWCFSNRSTRRWR